MNKKDTYLQKLDNVARLASASKWGRLFHNPYKYVNAIFFKEFIYPRHKKAKMEHSDVFFGKTMLVALPASTDIYLTGGKSHDSEIRLAKFLIKTLQEGDTFMDIGAHYGYFTLLAAQLVGSEGKVYAFEPSNSFEVLKTNAAGEDNVYIYKQAIAETDKEVSFFEFPNLYSEYNSMDISQFNSEKWYAENQPVQITVEGKTVDTLARQHKISPRVIKIDVEGGEYKVISGAVHCLQDHSPYIIMEYLCADRHNIEHQKAAQLLHEYNYEPYCIDAAGNMTVLHDIDAYLKEKKLESDNIVFKKSVSA